MAVYRDSGIVLFRFLILSTGFDGALVRRGCHGVALVVAVGCGLAFRLLMVGLKTLGGSQALVVMHDCQYRCTEEYACM